MNVNMIYKWILPFSLILIMNGVRSDDDFLTPFQTEIDQIPKDLDTLILHIEQNYSPETEPSSSIQPIQLCVPSQEEYLEFWSIVNNFDDENDNPSITIVQSNSCSENDELDKLKLWILQLKNNFYELLQEVVWSDKYVQMKSDYENILTKMTKHIDASDKKVEAKGKAVISKLRTEYKIEENKIRKFFYKLQDKKRVENDNNAKLCIAEVIANRIDSAVKIFNSISEERQLRSICAGAYENEDNFQRIFDFIERLGDSPAVLYGYQGLMLKMASKMHLKPLNLLIFLNAMEKREGSTYTDLANSLQKNFSLCTKTGDYKDVYTAVNTRISGNTDFGQSIMPTFIRGVYKNDVKNVMKVLDMRSNFYYMRHKLYLVDALITEMKIQDHTNKPEFFIVLADLIDIKAEVFKQSNENDKKIVNSVFQNIPDNLLPLMHPKLCIQNSNNNEFMHAGDAAVDGQRQISTAQLNRNDDTFSFEAEFLERGRTLLLKNSRYGEYLYSIDGVAPRKLVLMKGNFKDDEQAHYAIEGMDSINVRIKNKKFNEFLYSSNGNERFVQSKEQVSEDGLWKLTTCSR